MSRLRHGPRYLSAESAARRGGLMGALVYLCFFAFCLALSAGFAVMGVENERLSGIVKDHYMSAIAAQEIKIVAAYMLIGLVVGAWGGMTGWALARLTGRRSMRRVWPWALGFSLATEALALLRAMVDTPATYAPWFYDQGGLLRRLQVFVTDHAHPAFFSALLAAIYLAAPLMMLARMAARGRLKLTMQRLAFLKRPWALTILAALAGAFAYQRCDLASRERPDQPDIIILVGDSIRPDHLGLESGRDTSPNLDRLATEAAYFKTAYTPLARTFPAWASILSGQAPKDHGIRSMFPSREEAVLNRSITRLLGEAGWRTVVISDYAGDIFPRFDAGFDEIHAPRFTMLELVKQRTLEGHRLLLPFITGRIGRRLFPELGEFPEISDPRLLGDEIIETIDKYEDRPLFLAAFFSVTHFPYAAPHPWYKAFTDPGYDGPYKYHKLAVPSEKITDERDIAQIRGLFDGSMLAFDCQVGRIVDHLKRSGRWDNTILIITADHGENLYEHGEDIGHGDHFRGMQSLRVPLIVKLAGGNASGEQDGLASLLDIAPTLAEATGVDIEWPVEGISLVPLLKRNEPINERVLYLETGIWFTDVSPEYFKGRRIPYPDISQLGEIDFKRDHLISIQPKYETLINLAKHRMRFDGENKLIYMPTQAGIKWELYNVRMDSGEENDLAPLSPLELSAMQQDLLRWIGSEPGIEISNGIAVPVSH